MSRQEAQEEPRQQKQQQRQQHVGQYSDQVNAGELNNWAHSLASIMKSLELTKQQIDLNKQDAECERLLRNVKKQVKQMMEEAVTKKFIHEESSNIMALCVTVDACLSQGIKRRALGLFKTNSSTALIQKVAKTGACPPAQEVLASVEAEEQQHQQHRQLHQEQQEQSGSQKSPLRQTAANVSNCANHTAAHRRHMWIKCALIDKKLVQIVEHLATNAAKYYEPDALMANYLCAQILCSLLVGPSALEFSRCKLNDYYQFEEPSADELLKRHKLANPIKCLCDATTTTTTSAPAPANDNTTKHEQHSKLFRSATASSGEESATRCAPGGTDSRVDHSTSLTSSESNKHELATNGCHQQALVKRSASPSRSLNRKELRRRPLALKNSTRTRGTLVTDCHHYSCQEISEHCRTRGYSLVSQDDHKVASTARQAGTSEVRQTASLSAGTYGGQATDWSLWSPRMLHETLHQNSRSRLLYAKNNVLLESQRHPGKIIAGYLSLHEMSQDLVLKWIPNQMINGGSQPLQSSMASGGGGSKEVASEPATVVESSYLDLVVNLSVSRIVLLQCQFGKISASTSNDTELVVEDTLILVEADGVQRAPFKFPKGGLRLLLSCLEQGLSKLGKYLDQAIKFHSSGGCPATSGGSIDKSPPQSPALSSPSASPSPSPTGRFDSLLRRLPSLKRPQATQPSKPLNVELSDNSGPEKETEKAAVENFVYRIVSLQQADWFLLQSSRQPPVSHSTSSLPLQPTSGNNNVNGSGDNQPSSAGALDGNHAEEQKFRWSLSRLTRFSRYRYTNTSTASSGSSAAGIAGTSSTTTHHQHHTFASLGDSSLEPSLDKSSLDDSIRAIEEKDNSRELARIEAKLDYLKKSTSDDVLATLRTKSIQTLCESMRKQIVARAFYGWLVHCRKVRIIKTHLSQLIKMKPQLLEFSNQLDTYHSGLTREKWQQLMVNSEQKDEDELSCEINLLVYYGGIENDELRKEVWPYLLEHYKFCDSLQRRQEKDAAVHDAYLACGREWVKIERVVKQRDREVLAANMAKASRESRRRRKENGGATAAVTNPGKSDTGNTQKKGDEEEDSLNEIEDLETGGGAGCCGGENENETVPSKEEPANLTKDSAPEEENKLELVDEPKRMRKTKGRRKRRYRLESTGSVGSDASITDRFGNNIHRIDKDVQRCDRSFWYFKEASNLEKLRNIMCTYVWQHLDVGYVQGMCDLAAPFLVIFDDELLAYTCFCQLMKRMVSNFPHDCAMDQHFESLKHLMQILDPKLFDVLQSNGDYTHFYFCYRWLLLDFKRELAYGDVYRVWETIWSARFIVSDHFVVFMALAMVRFYRDIIIENNMDFTDTIKFFNEMAERHNAKMILNLARDCIVELHCLMEGIKN